jgi:hypothetical protein
VDSSQARGSETVCRMEPTAAQRAARDRIAAELAAAGFALPGTLTVRAYACGKPGCRCHADPPRLHGPYAEWTRKIGGKTITRRLTPAELTEYQPLFDNARKLRALLSELQDLTLQIIATDSTQPPTASAEPEPQAPENVAEARLTRGQQPSADPFAQVRLKRENVSTGITCKARSEAHWTALILRGGWELPPYWEEFGRSCPPSPPVGRADAAGSREGWGPG